ncbi:unnamed protein product [Adineta ricciae]|uniref:RING-type domain-containing protein n=1 Tax=Adineta ricciae TaxID=249248 RepID=A0A813ZFT9_ADIRI|nr:unnamed protein product [Adineta ricciae]CAF1305247.1 unnamed protein product [Adineta ricciae]
MSTESAMMPSRTTSEPNEDSVELGDNNTTRTRTNETGWIRLFVHCDQMFGGGLLHICYRVFDVILLLIGLNQGDQTCHISNNLTSTTLTLLVFYLIDFGIIFLNFFRCILPSHHRLTEEEKSEQSRRVSSLRSLFLVFKLIPVLFGIGHIVISNIPQDIECQTMRFCVGMVCFSTILLMIMPPTKPVLPQRRSCRLECFIISFVLFVNGMYFLSVSLAMRNVEQSTCIYGNASSLYTGAPLKTYGSIGLIIFSCTTAIHIINGLISQLCNRLTSGRRIYSYYYAFQYFLTYFASFVIIYYLAAGALFLFHPRSGQPCRLDAPALYRVLLIWEWIRVLTPLVAVPLFLILCCVGVFFGFVLSYCLPASVTVPLLEVIRNWLSSAPVHIPRDPPATQAGIDAIPVVLFSKEPDPYNQTECAICQTSFKIDEHVKKLQCGHFFHSECVRTWLSITGICPVCRHRT